MATCISCGKDAEEGQFFCPECYARMTPEEAQPAQVAATAPPETPAPPEAAEKPEVSGKPETDATPEEPARPKIDAERSKVLTPASEKKKIGAGSVPVDVPAGAKKPKKEKTEQLAPAERIKRGTKRQGERLGAFLKSSRARAAARLKGLAFRERAPFDAVGWVSWSIGVAAALVLLISIFFLAYYRFEWILAGSQTIVSNKTSIMGIDMGGWSVVLVVEAVLLLVLYAWSLAGLKWPSKRKLNPDFLAACLCLLGVLMVFLTINDREALKLAIVDKAGVAYNLLEPGAMDYSADKMAYGPYVSIFALIVLFMASASRLSGKGASTKVGKRLSAWFASKKRGSHA